MKLFSQRRFAEDYLLRRLEANGTDSGHFPALRGREAYVVCQRYQTVKAMQLAFIERSEVL